MDQIVGWAFLVLSFLGLGWLQLQKWKSDRRKKKN